MGPDHCRRERGARPKGRGGVEPELPREHDDGAAEDQKARGHPDGSFGRDREQARDVAVAPEPEPPFFQRKPSIVVAEVGSVAYGVLRVRDARTAGGS